MGEKTTPVAPKRLFSRVQIVVIIASLIPMYWTVLSGDPYFHFLPNLLLFTGYREYTRSLWISYLHFDKRVKRDPTHIAEIQAKDFNFEALRYATENFKYPAVVRGLFLDTVAVKKWGEPGYLSSKIGEYAVPVVRTAVYNTLQNERFTTTFEDAYEEILRNESSKQYLFFPVQSRFNFNTSVAAEEAKKELKKKINQLVLDDLEIDKRIWNGFGTPIHRTYFGSQLVMGRGSNDSDFTTGTGWHCAMGNNWFAQVAGKKRWWFMDQKYSAYMHPLRGGMVNMQAGNRNMSNYMDSIPLRYVDINKGDLLYNPDWEWHTIKNYEGLAIGVPIRELNISLSYRNNFQYSSIVTINFLASLIGIDIGGYPPA